MAGGKVYDPKRQKMVKPKAKASKVLTAEQKKQVKQLINKNIETKSAYKTYATATYNKDDDMLVMSNDVFGGIGNGALDESTPGSNNRIGDAVSASGILFNFVIVARNTFVSSISYQLPWVSVRLMIFTANASNALLGNPTKTKCL